MIDYTDIAMAYEGIIRRCFNCNRYENGANTDDFYNLFDLFVKAIKSGFWDDYNKKESEMLAYLKAAMERINETDFADRLSKPSSQDNLGFPILIYILGLISAKLNNLNQ